PAQVRLDYADFAGIRHTEEADGLLAVCLQHEIDQLDGVFWLQRLSRLKREMVVKKWQKQQRR
uniref:peptide deformylase n=1 Tax=Acidisphaera sp. L21 TaxID=1641851 RepID=UPI001577001B